MDQRTPRRRLRWRVGREPVLRRVLLSGLCLRRAAGRLRAAALLWSRCRLWPAAAGGGSLLSGAVSLRARARLLRRLASLSLLTSLKSRSSFLSGHGRSRRTVPDGFFNRTKQV